VSILFFLVLWLQALRQMRISMHLTVPVSVGTTSCCRTIKALTIFRWRKTMWEDGRGRASPNNHWRRSITLQSNHVKLFSKVLPYYIYKWLPLFQLTSLWSILDISSPTLNKKLFFRIFHYQLFFQMLPHLQQSYKRNWCSQFTHILLLLKH